jgi:hypothetical protein
MKKRKKTHQLPNSIWKPTLYTSYHSTFQTRKKKNSYVPTYDDDSRQRINQKQSASVNHKSSVDNSKKNISTTMAWRLTARTTRRKYFDYFVFNFVDCDVNCGLLRSRARHQLTPECGNHPQDLQFRRHQQHDNPKQRSGAWQQLRLRLWLWFYDNNSTTSSSTTPRQPHRTR